MKIMKIRPSLWLALTCLLCAAGLNRALAQMVYTYDGSGNLTNGVLSASTGLAATVTNSTPLLMVGGALTLEAEAGGSGPITYQWRLNGANISGATNATLFKANVGVGDAGAYTVVITGLTGSVTNSLGNVTVLASTNTLYAAAYGLGQYIAVGADGAVVASTNLINWSAPTPGTTNQLRGIALGNNTFVAVGLAGTVVNSTNGNSWSVGTSAVTNDLNGIAFGNGVFVAVGTGGTIISSQDGTNWTRQTSDNPTLEGVTFGTNLFVAVGTGGAIWTSSNGTNWLGHDWSTTNFLSTVAFGSGQFIALGGSGLVLSSPDGTNWTQQTAPTGEAFTSALFFKNTFFGLGAIGENFISADGIRWGESPAGTFAGLYGSAVGSGVPIAVGANGTIVQIPYSQLDHFTWGAISSPQRAGFSFAASLTAQDAASGTVSNFNGSVTLSAAITQPATNRIIGSAVSSYSTNGSYTVGYSFTPTNNLLITQLWHYDNAQKVSIWDEDGNPVVSLSVTSAPSTWVATTVPVPVTLNAGTSYVLGVYTGPYSTNVFYYRGDMTDVFANGTIDQAFSSTGDAVPIGPETAFWFLVDLSYVVQDGQGITLSPSTVTLTNGSASFSASLTNSGQGVVLTAVDSQGHVGQSNPFNVYTTNDLALALTASPTPATYQSNLTYTITVMNPGPSSATGVNVTNTLPGSVSFVTAATGQGTWANSGGTVSFNVGTLAAQTTNIITITVTPSAAGVMLTNTATVSESGTDPNLSDNTATITTYVPPTLSISNFGQYEGNTGTTYWNIPVTLSAPSVLPVYFNVTTLDGTNSTSAVAWKDYVPLGGTWYMPAGVTTATLPVGIQGNTVVEPNKQFLIRLSDSINASLLQGQATITISNDDGLIGQVYQLAWGSIPSPQRTNQSFSVSVTAQDTNGTTVSGFSGPVSLTGINVNGPTSNTMITNLAPEFSTNVSISTVGYQFTPSTNIYVTHVRSYFGTKVSIWTDTGNPVVSQTVSNAPGTWGETPLPSPVRLLAGVTYRIGAYTAGSTYYWRDDDAATFADGQILEGYSSVGDAFPTNADAAQWYMVDFRYVRAASITPTSSGTFTSGVWTGNITAQEAGTNFVLMADDSNGHLGFSNPFGVYQANDMALTLASSPAVPLVSTNIVYTLTVLNPGSNASTAVYVTNTLPAGATFVSASSSQGTCTQSNGVVTCNVGTISNLANATVTITITPLVAGLPLTNSAVVVRNETDPNLANNSAVSVLTPSLALSLALAQATEYYWTAWRSGGNALWGEETNVTHDGVDAAQSGSIGNSQQTWMETSVRGPGTLIFWWKVSSQAGGDFLAFSTNGVTVTNISGNIDWQQVTFAVPAGPLTLRWSYTKDGSISSGSDCGWLDQVVYSVPSFTLNSPTLSTNGAFQFTLTGTNGQQLVLQSSTNLTQWTSLSTNSITGGIINFTDTSASNFMYQFYRALFINK